MPPPDTPDQPGAIDLSVPYQPAGRGPFRAIAPPTQPARDAITYLTDTALGALQTAASIPAGLVGASTALPGPPEQRAVRRASQDYWSDLGYWIGQAKSPAGRAQEAAGGPDITKEPLDALVQGAVGILPYAPIMATGPVGSAAIFGATSVGEARNKMADYIRFAPEEDLMKSPLYKQARDAGQDDKQARDTMRDKLSDVNWSDLISGATGALGGGLQTMAFTKAGSKLVSKAVSDKIMDSWWRRGLMVGGPEGFGAGAMMSGGADYANQQAMYEAGLGPPPSLAKSIPPALQGGATLGILGAAGKALFGRPPKEPGKPSPAPPIGTETEAAAAAETAGAVPPPGGGAGAPPPPPIHRGPLGEYAGPEYGPETPPPPPGPRGMTGADLGPGVAPAPTEPGRPMEAGDIGVSPGTAYTRMAPEDLGMGTSEYGTATPFAREAPRGRYPGRRAARPTDIDEEHVGPLGRYMGPEYGREIPMPEGRVPPPERPMGEGDIYGYHDLGPEITPRPLTPAGTWRERMAQAERIRRGPPAMTEGDLYGEYGPAEPPGGIARGGEREMRPEDITEYLSPEWRQATAQKMLADLEELKAQRARVASRSKPNQKLLDRLDEQISNLRRELINHNRRTAYERRYGPRREPPEEPPPEEPPPRGGPPPEGGPPEEPPPPPAGGPPEEPRAPTPEDRARLEELLRQLREMQGPTADIIDLEEARDARDQALYDRTIRGTASDTLRYMREVQLERERAWADRTVEANRRGDREAVREAQMRAAQARGTVEDIEEELNRRGHRVDLTPEEREEWNRREAEEEDSLGGVSGAQVLEEFGILPHPAGRGEERVLPERANVPMGEYGPATEPSNVRYLPSPEHRAMVPEDIRRPLLRLRPGTELVPEARREGRERVTQARESARPTIVTRGAARRFLPGVGGRQRVTPGGLRHIQLVAEERARREEGGAPIRAERVTPTPRAEAERRAQRAARAAGRDIAVDNFLYRIMQREGQRMAERRQQHRISVRLAGMMKRGYTGVRDRLRAQIDRILREVGYEPAPRAEETPPQRLARREADRERKRILRKAQYDWREEEAKGTFLDEGNLSLPQLDELVSKGFSQQFALGDWGEGIRGYYQPLTRRAAQLLREGFDPKTMDLEDRLRNFKQFVNTMPFDHLRAVAEQIRTSLSLRQLTGQYNYMKAEQEIAERMGKPIIRMSVEDVRRGVGPWHRRFAADRQMIRRISSLIGGVQTNDAGKIIGHGIGRYHTARTDRQRQRAYDDLRNLVADFYYNELMIRTPGGIDMMTRADREALQASQRQFSRAAGATRRGRFDPKEKFYAQELSDEIDRALADRFGDFWGDEDEVGREREPIAEDEETEIIDQMLNTVQTMEAFDRSLNPQNYNTEMGARKMNKSFRSMLAKFQGSLDRVPEPSVYYRAQDALNVLLRGVETPGRISLGATYFFDARWQAIERWLEDQRRAAAIDQTRTDPALRDATVEQRERAVEGARFQDRMAEYYSPGNPEAWRTLPPEFKALNIDFGVRGQLITPADVPLVRKVTIPAMTAEQRGGAGERLTARRQRIEAGLTREELATMPRTLTTPEVRFYQPPIEEFLRPGETEATLSPERRQEISAQRFNARRPWQQELARREQLLRERSPKMSMADIYLPISEQLEFLRRLQQGEGTETDYALRAQQLTDHAGRLYDAMNVDPNLWADPERGWSNEILQRLHEEMRERAGEPSEHPEMVTPDTIQQDLDRWSTTLQHIENEARDHYQNLNPDTEHMEYGVGNVLDPAVNLREGANLPRGAYVRKASDYLKPSKVYGIQAEGGRNKIVRHFLDVANKLIGDLDVVHLTDEQMHMALANRGLRTDAPGFYDRPTDRIIVRQSAMDGAGRDQLLIHELAHPIMESAAQVKDLRPILRRLDEQRQALREAFDNPEHPNHAEVLRFLDGDDHGLTNVHEFFSELWANPDFAKALHAVRTTAEQRTRWRSGSKASLLESVLQDIKRGLNGMFFTVSKQRLLNDSTIAGLDLLRQMEARGRRMPAAPAEGEPLARPLYRSSAPGRPSKGFVDDVLHGITERGKDIAHAVNQAGGPTGLIVRMANFSDLARMGDRGMQERVQPIKDTANQRYQVQKEIMQREDYPQIRALMNQLRVKSHDTVAKILDYMDYENYVGASGRHRLGEGDNAWVSRSRDEPGHRQIHNEWPELNRRWNELPEDSQKMIIGLRDYYKGRYDAIREHTLRDMLDVRGLIEGKHAGATDAMVKLVSEGKDALTPGELDLLNRHVKGFDGYDLPKSRRSADNNLFRADLAMLRNIPEFRKIAGVYYPMMRRGNHVVQGFFKLGKFAEPYGGVEQDVGADGRPTGHWQFDSAENANKFIDRLSQEDAPFVKVQKVHKIEEEGEPTRWMVYVNPMHLNFHESARAAFEEHAALKDDPNIDLYHLQARRIYDKGYMNPEWASKLTNDLIESTKRTSGYLGLSEHDQKVLSNQWKELAIRHLMTTSARSRYMPRSYTAGASRDAKTNLLQYATNTSHTLAELKMRPQMRAAVEAMDNYVRDMRGAKEPPAGTPEHERWQELQKWGLRRTQVQNEVHRRLLRNSDYQLEPVWTRALQMVLKLSFLDKLMSPGFLLLNASEPWTIAAPLMAGEHGPKAYGELAKAYDIIGSGKVWSQGAADFVKVLKAGMHGDPQLADTLTLLTDKIKRTGFSDKHSSNEELVQLMEYLQKNGYLDRNAGLELEHALDPMSGRFGRFVNWMDNAFRQANIQVENVNRGTTAVAAYRLHKMKLADKIAKGEMTAEEAHQEAMAKAQDMVDKGAGDYGYINAPELFNKPGWKFALQFKKYALRVTSNNIRLIASAVRGEPKATAQLIAQIASQVAVAGALGLPTEPLKALITATNAVGLNPYNTDDVENIMNQYLAGKLGREGKDALLYGLPRLLGTGFGNRLDWSTLWTYGTLGNKRDDLAIAAGHLIGGAPGGYLMELMEGSNDMAQGIASYLHGAHTQGAQSMANGMAKLIPVKIIADALPAIQDYNSGRQRPSGQPFDFKPTLGDTVSRIAGIRTARDVAASQARGAFIRQRDVYTADRSRQLQGYAQARTPAERSAIREYILRDWNTGRPDVQRITVGDLQRASTAFERKSRLSPADLGLAISKRMRPFAPNPNVYGFMPSGG